MEKIIMDRLQEMDYDMLESMRSLRTNLLFCGDGIKSVLVTSSLPDEGKSTISMNIARSFAEAGNNVALIDCDLRKSVMIGENGMRLVSGNSIYGLSHYLSGQKKLEEVLYETDIENMSLILSGPVVPNPTELLENHYFDKMMTYMTEKYDMVILDGSPLGLVIDSAVIAPKCDGTILVIEQGNASRKFIQGVKLQLEQSGAKIFGVVLNKVQKKTSRYYNKYYKDGYGQYGNNDDK